MLYLILASCSLFSSAPTATEPVVELEVSVVSPLEGNQNCAGAKNTCPDYSTSWVDSCPEGSRCIEFRDDSSTDTVALAYQIGCNGDGTPGAPQCNCTFGPVLSPGQSTFFLIEDGNYASCLPSWQPACLTAGLAVIANNVATCSEGTRIEFTAGNSADPYGRFDSYDIDTEPAKGGGQFYSIPVMFAPKLKCANDYQNHDCRPLWCEDSECPDAYGTPTTGSCPDGRSPQVGCQDTFSDPAGYIVSYYPKVSASCSSAIPCNAATP